MEIKEVKTGKFFPAAIVPVEAKDYRVLTKKRYFFDWKLEKEDARIYKLIINGQNDILGLIAIKEYPREQRSEIKLVCVARENKGSGKKFDRITGCLIAFACRQAKLLYGLRACVSLIPKTGIKDHYMKKYGMADAGWQIFLELTALDDVILNYLA